MKIGKLIWTFGATSPISIIIKKTPIGGLIKFININLTFVQIKNWVIKLRGTGSLFENSAQNKFNWNIRLSKTLKNSKLLLGRNGINLEKKPQEY